MSTQQHAIGSDPSLRLHLLGGPRAVARTGNDVALSQRSIGLLAYLILHRSQLLRRDAVSFALWPDEPESQARANLRRHLHVLSGALGAPPGEPFIIGEQRMIGWNARARAWVDIIAFEELAAQAATAGEVVELYAGDLLPSLEDEWLTEPRERLRLRLIEILVGLIDRAHAAHDYATAIAHARRLLAHDPWREDTVRKLIGLRNDSGDRGGAHREFREFAKRLHDELGVDPMPETCAMAESLPSAEYRAPRHNLPAPLTTFIGREAELDELAGLLPKTRLLTLTGPGGIGKTRFALAQAWRVVDSFVDGVWFVDLSPVGDSSLVASALLHDLSLREEPGRSVDTTLIEHFKNRSALLVLDNCEHVRANCANLAKQLLQACPALQILATSREVLAITGEATFRVSPLDQASGVRLFADRAAAVLPSFGVTAQNEQLVAAIVRRLDAIPLAIELAAARIKMMSPSTLLDRLEDRLRLLSSTDRTLSVRQQTLRATIDWSYELLAERECRLFGRLALFSGSWTLDAAESVCTGEGLEQHEVLDLMESLLDKSLAVADSAGDVMRFRFLDTVRGYAHEKLVQSSEGELARERHVRWFTEFAERMEPLLYGAEQLNALERVAREIDNVRSALELALEPNRPPDFALRLAVALSRYWFVRNNFSEGRAALTAVLERGNGDEPGLRGKAMVGLCFLLLQHRELDDAAALAEKALQLARLVRDEQTISRALCIRAFAAVFLPDLPDRDAVYAELQERADVLGDAATLAMARFTAGLRALRDSDAEAAAVLLEDALAIVRRSGDPYDICGVALQLGYTRIRLGDEARWRRSSPRARS